MNNLNHNRRSMLAGLAGLAAAAATGTTVNGQPGLAESPELLNLADQLPRSLEDYLSAKAEVSSISET